jgi:hypothetical protein
MTTITFVHPRNKFFRLAIQFLSIFGIDASENTTLTKKEVYENCKIKEIFMSPEFSEYIARFGGRIIEG